MMDNMKTLVTFMTTLTALMGAIATTIAVLATHFFLVLLLVVVFLVIRKKHNKKKQREQCERESFARQKALYYQQSRRLDQNPYAQRDPYQNGFVW